MSKKIKYQLYRVGKSWYGKWNLEIDRNYPIGNDWHVIAKHTNKKLLLLLAWVLNKLDKDFTL